MEETLFKEKFRVESTRLPHWNYADPGYYFVTICTDYFVEYFGKVEKGSMMMNERGSIVANEWLRIPQTRSGITLDGWAIMPNHIHGIIVINGDHVETPSEGVSTKNTEIPKRNAWSPGVLGSIINQYKRSCTVRLRTTCPEFSWQPRFYDHIIRDRDSLDKIRQYISDNPAKWDRDRNHDFLYLK